MKNYIFFVKKDTGTYILVDEENEEELKQMRESDEYFEYFILK